MRDRDADANPPSQPRRVAVRCRNPWGQILLDGISAYAGGERPCWAGSERNSIPERRHGEHRQPPHGDLHATLPAPSAHGHIIALPPGRDDEEATLAAALLLGQIRATARPALRVIAVIDHAAPAAVDDAALAATSSFLLAA
jgi:hypothetical protein